MNISANGLISLNRQREMDKDVNTKDLRLNVGPIVAENSNR
jgi:hypothetical protein